MLGAYTYVANAEASGSSDILGTLGIDIKLLVMQTIAFLLLLWLLSKFVFPKLGAMLEAREKSIDESVKAAHEAEANALKSKEQTAKLMKEARKQADEALLSAKTEATAMVDAAEKKARERSEKIVAEAEAEISRNVAAAKKTLRNETLGLVAEATEKVVRKLVDAKVDKTVVAEAVKEAEGK